MKSLSTHLVIALATLTLGLGACKKKEEAAAPPAPTDPAKPPVADPAKPPVADPATPPPAADPAAPPPAAAVDPAADFIKVTADHVDKTKGKVDVTFKKFTVTKANFDPAKVEGGTAEIEIDLLSLGSGIDKRDAHLHTPDYLDTAKFGKAVVKVDNVKKTADNKYTADANVNLHGVEKKYPVAFEVVETLPDGVRVKATHTFPRMDFAIGKAEGDGVDKDLIVDLQLTLKKV